MVDLFYLKESLKCCCNNGSALSSAVAAVAVVARSRAVSPIPGLPAAVRVTSSFGVAEIGEKEPLRFAMRRADDALYAAKNAGRDCVREADPPAQVLEVVKRTS